VVSHDCLDSVCIDHCPANLQNIANRWPAVDKIANENYPPGRVAKSQAVPLVATLGE